MNYKAMLMTIVSLALISSPVFAKNDKEKDRDKSKELPPGLQKKVEKGKPLPPGWQKKLSRGDILDRDIYDRGKVVVPAGKDGVISIEVDGTILKLYKNTREIIDILDR